MTINPRLACLAVLLLVGGACRTEAAGSPSTGENDRSLWSISGSAYAFFVPDGQDYIQPAVTADRAGAHFEARYNYEDLETASIWLGLNFSAGEKVSLAFTPMVGAVFGQTAGVAPGFHVSLDWQRLSFASEGEYLFDAEENSDSFFYSWSELTASLANGFRGGLVGQRTRVYESKREVQWGGLVALNFKSAELGFHLFNPTESHPLVVLSLAVGF